MFKLFNYVFFYVLELKFLTELKIAITIIKIVRNDIEQN